MSSFCICKSYSHFFSKNTCDLDIVLTRTVNTLTTNKLVKLTMLWTTVPRAHAEKMTRCETYLIHRVCCGCVHTPLRWRVVSLSQLMLRWPKLVPVKSRFIMFLPDTSTFWTMLHHCKLIKERAKLMTAPWQLSVTSLQVLSVTIQKTAKMGLSEICSIKSALVIIRYIYVATLNKKYHFKTFFIVEML